MVKLFPIGGIGNVTKNMYLYEYEQEILIIDCGIGFPDASMPGIEFLIPDISYLKERLSQGATIVGMVLTHGHDDHIAALPYIYPEIGVDFPIHGSPLTAEFAMSRMKDMGIEKQVQYFNDGQLKLGSFTLETINVTHSVPDTRHLVIRTPDGIIYHGSDFKIDLNPVDGIRTDMQKIAMIGQEGVLCALVDCLRIERPLPGASESAVGPALRREMHGVTGKVFVTLMSSNIHRIQQTINVAAEFGRKVTFIGRSIEQNVNTTMNMGLLHFPANVKLNKKNIDKTPDEELCIIIAGSQGQPGSSLVRAVAGEHRFINVQRGDKIIFSSEPIPGSERNVYQTVDKISEQGIEVVYSDIEDNLHVSGHASAYEQMTLINLLQAKYLFPIGGEERHRVLFRQMAQKQDYDFNDVVMPDYGKIVEFDSDTFRYGEQVQLQERTADGVGVSNVVEELMNERQALGKNGVVVLTFLDRGGELDAGDLMIISKGFSEENSDQDDHLERVIRENIGSILGQVDIENGFQAEIEHQVGKMLMKEFNRSPMVIVTVSSEDPTAV